MTTKVGNNAKAAQSKRKKETAHLHLHLPTLAEKGHTINS